MSLNAESEEQASSISSPGSPKMKINTKENTQMVGEAATRPVMKRQSSFSPQSHREGLLAKSSNARCLCSPTTHAGSFRCRYHRNLGLGGLVRGGSVGSNLSLLAAKSTPVGESKLNSTNSDPSLLV